MSALRQLVLQHTPPASRASPRRPTKCMRVQSPPPLLGKCSVSDATDWNFARRVVYSMEALGSSTKLHSCTGARSCASAKSMSSRLIHARMLTGDDPPPPPDTTMPRSCARGERAG